MTRPHGPPHPEAIELCPADGTKSGDGIAYSALFDHELSPDDLKRVAEWARARRACATYTAEDGSRSGARWQINVGPLTTEEAIDLECELVPTLAQQND